MAEGLQDDTIARALGSAPPRSVTSRLRIGSQFRAGLRGAAAHAGLDRLTARLRVLGGIRAGALVSDGRPAVPL
jgi:hypothetical protein